MQQFTGEPDEDQTAGIPTTSNTQPVIVAWHNQIKPQWLTLHSDYADGSRVPYTLNYTSGNVLELRPSAPLASGGYCFVQGDPMGLPGQLATWCFRVGAEVTTAGKRTSAADAGAVPWITLGIFAVAASIGGYLLFRRANQKPPPAPQSSRAVRTGLPAFCMHCGQPASPGARFCQYCGKSLT
jgi:hypothetical protein